MRLSQAAAVPGTPSFWRRLWRYVRDERARYAFLALFVVALGLVGAAVWLLAAAPSVAAETGARATASRVVLLLLLLNLGPLVLLGLIVGVRVLDLVRDRASDAGARLHLRFVTLFSAVAVVPAVLIALVFGVLVNRGVEAWFSETVVAAVENGADIGRAYVGDVSAELEVDLATMTTELGNVRDLFDRRLQFSTALAQIGAFFGYPAVYVLNSQGEVLAEGEVPGAPPYVAPPVEAFEQAAGGEEVSLEVTEGPDAIRAVTLLPGYPDSFLYVVRPLEQGLVARLRESDRAIQTYRQAEESRDRIQATFVLSYVQTALLVLVGAVWLGMSAANAISRPIADLVTAANALAAGDLGARVEANPAVTEINLLSSAFNRMAEDLEGQQQALRRASDEAQARSLFTETVLSGVSAGVIGLDREGRVSALNDSARELLALPGEALSGYALADVAPELDALIGRGEPQIEEDVDVTRDGETRRLRVRVQGGLGGEAVMTFDDITRLVTAQRNAAWRDVARRIAHEIKNPLTPIQLSAERLRRKYRSRVAEDVEVFDRCTETIIRQVGDIGRMVDEFSGFARMPAPRFAAANPSELLREAAFAQRVAAPGIEVRLAEPLPTASLICDRSMVGQALTNVLKNAGEAILARRALDGAAAGAMSVGLEIEDGAAVFVVEDDGIGLPDKDRDRLIEPYVTTREKGTGLGLAIVRRICEDHGGTLKLADAVELSGARVCLVFPLRPEWGASRPETPAATAN
jgi:two-component system nitrogen regulation sensor histidine kinase NtrY